MLIKNTLNTYQYKNQILNSLFIANEAYSRVYCSSYDQLNDDAEKNEFIIKVSPIVKTWTDLHTEIVNKCSTIC